MICPRCGDECVAGLRRCVGRGEDLVEEVTSAETRTAETGPVLLRVAAEDADEARGIPAGLLAGCDRERQGAG